MPETKQILTKKEIETKIDEFIQERVDYIEEWKGNEYDLLRKVADFISELYAKQSAWLKEENDLLNKKLEYYREQTDKVRELVSNSKEIGKPCQPLYDAIVDRIKELESASPEAVDDKFEMFLIGAKDQTAYIVGDVEAWEKDGSCEKGDRLYKAVLVKEY